MEFQMSTSGLAIWEDDVEYGFHWCQRSSLMKKEMTWHVLWCDMCDEVAKSYDDVLVLLWSHFTIWHNSVKIWQLAETLKID